MPSPSETLLASVNSSVSMAAECVGLEPRKPNLANFNKKGILLARAVGSSQNHPESRSRFRKGQEPTLPGRVTEGG
jgi:hypothetical protein